MKKFNVTGTCVSTEDYMVDISSKIKKIIELINNRCYFTINRARQYGKTTTLSMLQKALPAEYICARISFQNASGMSFETEQAFCQMLLKKISKSLEFSSVPQDYIEYWVDENISNFELLDAHITKMCKDKKVVLLIDEFDRTSNNLVFLHFLSTLREKFLLRKEGIDYTFHSVILAGVYDIKNIKLKMIEEGLYSPTETENKIYNSPWNIAVNFDVDMSFNPEEIATMLNEYEADYDTGMNISETSEEIYGYTGGYPFFVSRICQHIDEKLDKKWNVDSIREAVKIILAEKNMLFDDVFKNLENNKELYDFIYNLLIIGEKGNFVADDPIINIGLMYGFLNMANDNAIISNQIFAVRMANYFISKESRTRKQIGVLQYDVVKYGKFDMELCMRKFAEHYAEILNDNDIEFIEKHGRLLFLSYLKPLINGEGFYHIESQLTDLRRMDIVVDYGREQFIIELKIWRGEQYKKEAYEQLCGYLNTKRADTGYLLTFDFRKEANKERGAEWLEINGKRIFDIIV